MKLATIAIVGVGLLLAVALGWRQGFDVTSLTILGFIAVTGVLAIAAVARSERGVVGPARCDSCTGVISPNAPYCKHCGAQQA